jgi:hypothetical protein
MPITVEAEAECCHPQLYTREQTMPHKTDRENRVIELQLKIAERRFLRDDQLNAVTGGVGKTIGAKAKIPDGRFSI